MNRPPLPLQDSHPLASLSAAAAAAHYRSTSTASPNAAAPPVTSSATVPGSSPNASHPSWAGHLDLEGGRSLTHSPESTDQLQQHHPRYHPAHGGSIGKRRRVDPGADSPGATAEGKKKSKTVSCTECKRRKIKCDRKIPCLACCKRGEPEACNWSEEAAVPVVDVQPFALTSDLLRLATRLEALEAWTQGLPPELRRDAPPPQAFTPGVYGSKVKGAGKERHVPRGGGSNGGKASRSGTIELDDEPLEAASRDVSDTEDAALKLESMAFNTRAPDSQYRPQDSLPFLDTNGGSTLGARSVPVVFPTELTAWRTSIVAPPLVFEGPWSASAIGLNFCSNLDEMRAAKDRALSSIWPFMPGKVLSFKLVQAYFDEIEWMHLVVHRQSFEAEHVRLWEMLEAGRGSEIDPMWLACYFMVLALALDGLRCQKTRVELTAEERKHCVPHTWFALCQRLIQLGDATGRPQVRYIQATILIGQWLQCCSLGGQAGRFLSLIATAIRAAQLLGIHQLTEDPTVMPAADPAWPPNACSLRRELALRLFGLLSFLDFISASNRLRSYLIDPSQCTTPPVSNVNLDELSITTCELPQRSRDIYTDSSFEYAKFRLGCASREVVNKLASVSDSSAFTYDTILALDQKYRAFLRECSVFFMREDISTRAYPSRAWKEAIAEEGLHSRLVRLHRPFMARHAYSRSSCLESAEKLVRSDAVITAATKNAYFVYSHCLTASICLFGDLFHCVDLDLPEPEVERKKEVLLLATQVFGHADEITSPSLRHVVLVAGKILHILFAALEKRRVARAATALVPGARKGDAASPESFAVVLQRLTRELDLAQPALHRSPAPPEKLVLPASVSVSAAAPLPAYTIAGTYLVPPAAAAAAGGYGGGSGAGPSAFATEQFGTGLPSDLGNNTVDLNSDVFLSNDFFREVGLTAPNGSLAAFDFWPGTATSAATSGPAASSAAPYAASGGGVGGDGYYGTVGALPTWDFGNGAIGVQNGSGVATGAVGAPAGDGGPQDGRMAATALMDQLTTGGGVW